MINKISLKLILTVILAWSFLATSFPAYAADPVEINFFFSKTCSVCAAEKVFLAEIEQRSPEIIINRHDVADEATTNIIKDFYQNYEVPSEVWGLVPATFIGDRAYLGFDDKTQRAMEDQIAAISSGEISGFLGGSNQNDAQIVDQSSSLENKKIKLPFLDEFSVISLSPLFLSIVVGLLDGFNVCALVALGILLAILVSTGDRKRVIIVGGVFVLVSGLIYYIFIAAWLNIFLFFGYIKIITYIVSGLILLFALIILKEYFNEIICKLCHIEGDGKDDMLTRIQKYLFAKTSKAVSVEMPLIWTIITVAVISAGINTIELVCSLGFPLAYTKILAARDLATYQYYLYLLVYVFFYILIELVIFLMAVGTMRMKKIPHVHLKIIKLISGLMLLALGLIMLFKPELLTF